METSDLLIDAFGRIRGIIAGTLKGLTPDQLALRPAGAGNPIGWLVWHLSRIQDDHIADVAGAGQQWIEGGWDRRFGFPFRPGATGYGQGPEEVAAVRVESGQLLLDYHDAVYHRTLEYVRGVTAGDLDRVVDESWDPPVTLGVRLVSVVGECFQHAGQAAYIRGLLPHL